MPEGLLGWWFVLGEAPFEVGVGDEKAQRDDRGTSDEDGKEDAPAAFEPAEKEREGKEAKESAMNATCPFDGFMMSCDCAANHGTNERQPREAFDDGNAAEALEKKLHFVWSCLCFIEGRSTAI